MSRYIDAEKLQALFLKRYDELLNLIEAGNNTIEIPYFIGKLINEAPTADVKPVIRGEWIYDKDGNDWGIGAWRCSICKCKNDNLGIQKNFNPLIYVGSKFCPHCGAKMDGEK